MQTRISIFGRFVLGVTMAFGAWVATAAEAPAKVLFLYGGRSHGPGAHEFKAGATLLAKCLNAHLH